MQAQGGLAVGRYRRATEFVLGRVTVTQIKNSVSWPAAHYITPVPRQDLQNHQDMFRSFRTMERDKEKVQKAIGLGVEPRILS